MGVLARYVVVYHASKLVATHTSAWLLRQGCVRRMAVGTLLATRTRARVLRRSNQKLQLGGWRLRTPGTGSGARGGPVHGRAAVGPPSTRDTQARRAPTHGSWVRCTVRFGTYAVCLAALPVPCAPTVPKGTATQGGQGQLSVLPCRYGPRRGRGAASSTVWVRGTGRAGRDFDVRCRRASCST